MTHDEDGAERRLRDDDERTRQERAKRAHEVVHLCPIGPHGVVTFGGAETGAALIESRLAFVQGLFLASVLTALLVLERHFAAVLYARGLDKARKMTVDELFRRATIDGLVTEHEKTEFDWLREARNSYAHFRDASDPMSGIRRAVVTDTSIENLWEQDARKALSILGSHFERQPYPPITLHSEP